MENKYSIKWIAGLCRRVLTKVCSFIPQTNTEASVTIVNQWLDIPQSKNWDTIACTKRIRKGIWELNSAESETESPGPVLEQHYEVFKLLGRGPKKLLDFGCGNGSMYHFLKRNESTRNWAYTGTDVNGALIHYCRKTSPGGEFIECDKGFLESLQTNSYDIVVACGSLQYVKEAEFCLSELARISSDMIVLSRLAVCETLNHTVVTVQKVRHADGTEMHPAHLFFPGDVVNMALANNLVLVKQIKGAESFHVETLTGSLDLMAFRKSLK